MALLLSLTACSLPEVTAERLKTPPRDTTALFSTSDPTKGPPAFTSNDKSYLATVHMRFGETDTKQINFDVLREKSDRIVAKLWQTDETTTTLHLGFSQSDGASIGTKFIWRF